MKIAVTALGPTLDDKVDPRFGRCPYFLIIDTDDLSVEALPNPHITVDGCAGHPTADLLGGRNIKAVLTGACGPHHGDELRLQGIELYTAVTDILDPQLKVREAVEKFKAGEFSPGVRD
jgi:predicted Fe-Mo cluster-binding NifX family protein